MPALVLSNLWAGEPGEEREPELESPYSEVIANSAPATQARAVYASNGSSYGASAAGAIDAPAFFPNEKMTCTTAIAGPGGCGQLVEPEVASAPDGTIYVTAQEGVPAGVDLWRRDPGSYEYKQLPKPDADEPLTSSTGFALGGGDNDLAVTTDGRVLVASLSLISAPVSYSTDRGETFTKEQFANGLVNVDRQWMTTVGKDTVYLTYHDNLAAQIWLVKSTDGGETWSSPQPILPPEMLPQAAGLPFVTVGNYQSDIVADPDGRVVLGFLAPKDPAENATPLSHPDSLYVAITDTNGENPNIHKVFEGDENIQGLFPAFASDKAGNLYATWTDKHSVFLSISRDHGATWSGPRKISGGKGNTSTVFPFVIAGTKGRIALAWLGSDAESNDDEDAKWLTYFAMTTDALAKDPVWTQVVASDHVVHTGSVCLEGLTCDITMGNRNLTEVLQMGLTKDGRVIISYPDDSSTSFGWTFLAEQRFGPGLYNNVKPSPPPLPPDKPGGPVRSLVNRLGNLSFYFTGGDAGSGLQDPEGNEIDEPGDTGAISTKPGEEGHVASAQEWTTYAAGISLGFESEPLTSTQILGGNLVLTTFLAEATSDVQVGAINVRLFDEPPGEDSLEQEIALGETAYVAGVEATKGVYMIKVPKPFEVLTGHRLRVEIFFYRSLFTNTLRFYYGNSTYPAGFTLDRFTRVTVQGSKASKHAAKPRADSSGRLPATGVGSSVAVGVILIAAAGLLGRRVLRWR